MRKRTKPSTSSRAAASEGEIATCGPLGDQPAGKATQIGVLARLPSGAVHEVMLSRAQRLEVMRLLCALYNGGPVVVSALPCEGVTLLDSAPPAKPAKKSAKKLKE